MPPDRLYCSAERETQDKQGQINNLAGLNHGGQARGQAPCLTPRR